MRKSIEAGIFESAPAADAPQFAVDFLAAVPIGADLSLVAPLFFHWLLVDAVDGLIRFAKTDTVSAAVRGVGDLLTRSLAGETIALEQWQIARNAADAARGAPYATDDINAPSGDDADDAYIYPYAYVDSDADAALVAGVADTTSGVAAACYADASYATFAAGAAAATVYAFTLAAADAPAAADARRAARTKQAAMLLRLLRESPVAK